MIQLTVIIGNQLIIEVMANIITEINAVKCFYMALNLWVFENVNVIAG